ncbi:hypothetical protein [Brenneria uluponensis]|uniref:hypothetical protein n=1 Tax=Brenneria uluponensis TaxID=3057057 RepID=UPI0028EFD01C|nr:hypothetical protein [Brenneria ulupoensis]
MTTAYFSPSMNSLIPVAWKDDGTYTEDAWSSDAVLATDEEVITFWKQTPPTGKILEQSMNVLHGLMNQR